MTSSTLAACVVALLAACSDTPEGKLVLVRDDALDTKTPTTLVLEEVKDGVRKELSRKPWAAGGLELGTLSRSESGQFRAYGLDEKGLPSHGGKTLALAYESLESARIPLFVAPVDRFVHLPGTVDTAALPKPIMATERVVVLPSSGGLLTAYDLLALASVDLMANPKAATIAAVGSKLLLVNDTGATSHDLSTSTTTALSSLPDAPDVAGGNAVAAGTTNVYVVGPTRSTPSSTVWYWGGESTVARTALSAPRAYAAAVFAPGLGLVVMGGGVENAEVVTPGASQAFSLPASTKTVQTACSTGGTRLLTVDELGAVSTFDASCRQTCPMDPWPLPVMKPKNASLACVRGRVLYATHDDVGLLHAFALTKEGSAELPLPAGRKGATLFPLPTEHVALIGGASSIDVVAVPESLAPR